jgi:hypothetical protein
MINGLEQDVFIVIDALDDCPLPERRELLGFIEELRKRGGVRCCLSAASAAVGEVLLMG